MKPTAYKIGEGERKGLSKDMQEVILAYEEENAELKEHKENLIWLDKKKDKEIEKLEEENKKLRNQLQVREDTRVEQLNFVREENRSLKSELSKFSEAYKKYRDYEKEELAESCYDLARENQKLREENEWFNKKIKQAGKYVAATMKENKKLKEDLKLIKYYKSQMEEIKKESAYKIKKMKEKLRYYTKKS